ncbi:MAG: HEPN domain protein [Parcubacteria group bacterium GW2011_GWA2_47_26]|nr:MAG: HEPN domain protein [Parcubacteria group bacterium GW2011_GWA2_47_26]
MPKTKYVMQWLERANDDLDSADVLAREGGSLSIICFLAQQAAEKCLKAFLAFSEQHVRKIHDLEELVLLCAGYCVFKPAVQVTDNQVITRLVQVIRALGFLSKSECSIPRT